MFLLSFWETIGVTSLVTWTNERHAKVAQKIFYPSLSFLTVSSFVTSCPLSLSPCTVLISMLARPNLLREPNATPLITHSDADPNTTHRKCLSPREMSLIEGLVEFVGSVLHKLLTVTSSPHNLFTVTLSPNLRVEISRQQEGGVGELQDSLVDGKISLRLPQEYISRPTKTSRSVITSLIHST